MINLYGASGHAKVILNSIRLQPNLDIGYVFDDNDKRTYLQELPVHLPNKILLKENPLILSIGNNRIREKLAKNLSVNWAMPIFHPHSSIDATASLGLASVVMAQAVINAATHIGQHVIINSGAVIEHDCKIDDFAHISPQAVLAGEVSVGAGTHLGIGVQVLPGVKIGSWCTIGAGTVILKDVPDGVTVVGNPGRIIKTRNS